MNGSESGNEILSRLLQMCSQNAYACCKGISRQVFCRMESSASVTYHLSIWLVASPGITFSADGASALPVPNGAASSPRRPNAKLSRIRIGMIICKCHQQI